LKSAISEAARFFTCPMSRKSRKNKPKRYPSDSSQGAWNILKRFLPAAKSGGRPREVSLRRVINGIFYVLVTGLMQT